MVRTKKTHFYNFRLYQTSGWSDNKIFVTKILSVDECTHISWKKFDDTIVSVGKDRKFRKFAFFACATWCDISNESLWAEFTSNNLKIIFDRLAGFFGLFRPILANFNSIRSLVDQTTKFQSRKLFHLISWNIFWEKILTRPSVGSARILNTEIFQFFPTPYGVTYQTGADGLHFTNKILTLIFYCLAGLFKPFRPISVNS